MISEDVAQRIAREVTSRCRRWGGRYVVYSADGQRGGQITFESPPLDPEPGSVVLRIPQRSRVTPQEVLAAFRRTEVSGGTGRPVSG